MSVIKEPNDYKQKIYRAAEDLFYEKGYSDTSVMDIIKASGTNKGSFYHYYKSKMELGEAVLLNSHFQHNKNSNLFPDEDSLVLFAFENLTLWYTYFFDTNLFRFSRDLNEESLHFETRYVYDPFFSHTKKRVTRKEFLMIVAANQGIRSRLASIVYDNIDSYNYAEVSEFYMRHFMKLFEIPQNTIDYTTARAAELFDMVDVRIERFAYYLSLKQ